jgi:hypothetical protein
VSSAQSPAPRGIADGWAISDRQRRREALDLGLPVGKQRRGGHEQVRRLRAPRAPLVQEQERQHLDGLAEPHVVGQANAEPQRRGKDEPRHADLLIGPQRAAQIRARVGRQEPGRPAQPSSEPQARPRRVTSLSGA